MSIEWIVFGVVTLVLIYISRASLRDIKLHGFYRFFAWELIAALLLLNINHWFAHPLAWYQLVSWVLLILSLYLVIESVRLLRKIGKPDAQREDESLLGVEKTTQLVTTGLYAYIRHPMYSSLLCLAWGVFFKSPGWIGAGLALGASLFLVLTARMEESEDLRYFGQAYQDYMVQTKLFIPYLF